MRVPFPLKAFISYLAVLAAGALPTYIYIETSFVDELANARAQETANRLAILVEQLRPLPRTERSARMPSLSRWQLERLTYIGSTGTALFDSDVAIDSVDNVAGQPEVRGALGQGTSGPETLAVTGAGLAAARRASVATGDMTIYVAARLDEQGEVLRLAVPATTVTILSDKLRQVFRNSQAAALSVALLLSVVAAFVFMRPLQRLVKSALAIAGGDYTAGAEWGADDEISDVGNALNSLTLELRQRLANAQAAETLLIQAAEFLPEPMALVGPGDQLMVINGAFRRAIETSDADDEDVMSRLVGSKKYGKALDRAKTGENAEVLPWTEKKIGVVLEMHTLERPGTDPLVLLTVHEPDRRKLPLPSDVKAVRLGHLLDAAIERARPRTSGCKLLLDFVTDDTDSAIVVDAEHRAEIAISLLVEAAAHGREAIRLYAAPRGIHVEIWFDEESTTAPVKLIRMLLEPLGGTVESGETMTLKLPRA